MGRVSQSLIPVLGFWKVAVTLPVKNFFFAKPPIFMTHLFTIAFMVFFCLKFPALKGTFEKEQQNL